VNFWIWKSTINMYQVLS